MLILFGTDSDRARESFLVRVINGIVDVLKTGCRCCPPEYGARTTIYNRFVRWAEHVVWENLLRALAGNGRWAEKIHAPADAKGRLPAVLLAGREAHDCPVARWLTSALVGNLRIGGRSGDFSALR
jgi:transposase